MNKPGVFPTPFAKSSRRQPRTSWSDDAFGLAWPFQRVMPRELSEVAENREAFRSFLRLLLRDLSERKCGYK